MKVPLFARSYMGIDAVHLLAVVLLDPGRNVERPGVGEEEGACHHTCLITTKKPSHIERRRLAQTSPHCVQSARSRGTCQSHARPAGTSSRWPPWSLGMRARSPNDERYCTKQTREKHRKREGATVTGEVEAVEVLGEGPHLSEDASTSRMTREHTLNALLIY